MGDYLIQLLITYKYLILTPAAFFEGHLVSLASGFLSKAGYLNPFLAGACIMAGNLIGDTLLYWLGFHKGDRFATLLVRRFGVSDGMVEKSTQLLHRRKHSILFFSKITNGLGLAMAILFAAGAAKIPFRIYMFWNVIGEALWTGLLVSLGYFLGNLYYLADNVIVRASLISGCIVLGLLAFLGARKYFKKRFKV